MKKLLSFFAFMAIVFSFAACGGNNPEVKNFQIKVQALSGKAHFVITPPANNQKVYYFWWEKKSEVERNGTVRDYAEYDLSVNTFYTLLSYELIRNGKTDYWTDEANYDLDPNTPYVLYVCFIEVDGDYAKIAGDVEYVEFTTMPKNTLNGEFTVDANGKKVHFSQATLRNKNGSYYFFDNQWDYSGSKSNFPIDLFQWNAITYCPSPFYVLSKDEWWYMLKTRPNADKLFAHATVNGVRGLILLPDNWKTPDGIELTTSYQMGIVWDNNLQYKRAETDYDGYGQNKYDDKTWKVLEYAGAVFMPATWSSNNAGWYWTSSEKDDGAYEFSYGDYDLILSRLRVLQPKEDYASFRLVRDVNY